MVLRPLFLSLMIALTALAAPRPAAAQITPDQAKGFIQSMGNEAIKVLQQPGNTLAQREEKFRTILADGFAIPLIGKFVLGAFWNKASAEQKDEYLKLFADWIVKTYAIRFGGYSGEKFNVVDTRINPEDKDVFVGTRIDRPEGKQAIVATWRVRTIEGKPKIVDVQVDGVSMLVTHRSEFAAVGAQGGVTGIIASLKQRIDKLAQSS